MLTLHAPESSSVITFSIYFLYVVDIVYGLLCFILPQLNTQPQALSTKKKQKAVCKQTISKANIAMYTGFVYHHGHKIADGVML